MANQYLRKVSLIVSNDKTAVDLSTLKFQFEVKQSDLQTPNNIRVTIYNLSETTAQRIQKEFTRITLQAGYENGPFGLIFDGTVRQVFRGKDTVPSIRQGRISQTDTYLEICAGEGDDPYNFASVNTTLASGYTDEDTAKTLSGAMGTDLGPLPYQFGGNPAPRGKVMFGMARDYMRNLTVPNQSRWSFQGNTLQIIGNTAYLEGEEVVLNAKTGMLGMPEQTNDGIRIECLLNPKIKIGTRVKLNNADIQRTAFAPDYTAFNYPPPLSSDGSYRVLVAEHFGDTWGNDWATSLVCLSVDPSAAPQNSVQGGNG